MIDWPDRTIDKGLLESSIVWAATLGLAGGVRGAIC